MFRKLTMALVAPLLVAAGACAQEAEHTAVLTGDAAVAALRSAPDAAAEAGSGRFEMTMAFATPDGAFDVVATGGFSDDRMAMDMDLGSALADLAESSGDSVPAGFDEPMQIVIDGTTAYLRIPMLQALTGDTGWLSATPEELGAAGGPLGLGAGASDPAQLLDTLRGIADDVEEVGADEVRGVATTHLRATVDLAKALDEAPLEQRRMLEKQLEGFDASLAEIPVDVWVDGDGLVRRMGMDLGAAVRQAVGGTATMTIEFYDYGQPVEIQIPAPSDTKPFADVLGTFGGSR